MAGVHRFMSPHTHEIYAEVDSDALLATWAFFAENTSANPRGALTATIRSSFQGMHANLAGRSDAWWGMVLADIMDGGDYLAPGDLRDALTDLAPPPGDPLTEPEE